MRQVDLAALDLNLLVVLEALLLERHVTRAALRVHISQPAMSRALGRLREIFDDELLVRAGSQMQPTAKAEALVGPLRQVLTGIRELILPTKFNPAHATGIVRLAAPDVIAYLLGPPLLQRLTKDAPGLDLEIVQWSAAWREQLARGEVDLTFAQAAGGGSGIQSSPFFRSEWATVLRKGHPALRKRWSLDTFLSLRHLLISFTSQAGGHVDMALAALNRTRRVGLRMPYMVLSPSIVAESDLVLTTGRWLAEKMAAQVGLIIKEPPVELKLAPADLSMLWHERSHDDPKQRWLRALITELAHEAAPARPCRRTMKMQRSE